MTTARSTRSLLPTFVVASATIAIAVGRDLLVRVRPVESEALTVGSALVVLIIAILFARTAQVEPLALGIGRKGVHVRIAGMVALSIIAAAPFLPKEHVLVQVLSTATRTTPIIAIAVIGEELLCRGTLLTLALRSMSPALAVAFTSVTFALMHAARYPPQVLLLGIVAGALWGTWRVVTGDLVGPIAGHFVADFLAG
jgi:membrane protease YdiL (CAAX protease family)